MTKENVELTEELKKEKHKIETSGKHFCLYEFKGGNLVPVHQSDLLSRLQEGDKVIMRCVENWELVPVRREDGSNFKSKYFKLSHFDFTKKDVQEAIKDLERFKKVLGS